MIYSFSTLPFVRDGLETIEKTMLSLVTDYHPDLKAALSVILSSGGKRIRPILILLIGSMLKTGQTELVTLATAIEMLHTATLVHDDLIDGSILRRGIPTLNSKWSPAATVLTGDFLFASAAETASNTNSLEVMSLFSRTLMTIVNGEVNQLFSSRCVANEEEYFQRIYAKTASLFETSTHATAILSNLDEGKRELFRKFGYEIGMAFQVTDDILDYSGTESTVGKPVGGDLRQGIITLPMLYYMESHPADPLVRNISAGRCLQDEAEVQRVVASLNNSTAIKQAYQVAQGFTDRAGKILMDLPESPERESLMAITRYILERKK